MTKSIRTIALSAAVVLSVVPAFANPMGTNPVPQVAGSISLGGYLKIFLSVAGL